MLERLDELLNEGVARLRTAGDAQALEAWRIDFLGGKGRVKAATGLLKEVAPGQRPAFGQRLNEVKSRRARSGLGCPSPPARRWT
jgi:phenylalanyl-tRNA synthetase alpha chain